MQLAIVYIVIGIAMFFIIKNLVATFSPKKVKSGCAGCTGSCCGSCPISKKAV